MDKELELDGRGLSYVLDGEIVANNIAEMLNEISDHCGSKERFVGTFAAPSHSDAKMCYENNCTLWATLTLAPTIKKAWKPVEIPVLYPYQGVFVVAAGKGLIKRPSQAKLMFWHPCLTPKNGIVLMRDNRENGSGLVAKFNIIGGNSVISTNKDARISKYRYLNVPRYANQSVDEIHDKAPELAKVLNDIKVFLNDPSNIMLSSNTVDNLHKLLNLLKEAAVDYGRNDLFLDKNDLSNVRLYTYGVFLTEHLVHLICNKWILAKGETDPEFWSKLDNGNSLWEYISNEHFTPAPDKYTWLHPFQPHNFVMLLPA